MKKIKIYSPITRLCDIVLSAAALIVLFPFFIVLCLICAIDTKASPLFLQERIGKGSKPFKIIKFRTMKKSAPALTPARDISHPEEYVSRLGAFLRKSGADELPQLINILIGQMSFVGPRPLMKTEAALHRVRASLGVYTVRPGLTGLAQIKSDTINSHEEKAKLDAEYVQKMSLFYDVKLLFLTATLFLGGKHIDEHFNSPLS